MFKLDTVKLQKKKKKKSLQHFSRNVIQKDDFLHLSSGYIPESNREVTKNTQEQTLLATSRGALQFCPQTHSNKRSSVSSIPLPRPAPRRDTPDPRSLSTLSRQLYLLLNAPMSREPSLMSSLMNLLVRSSSIS